MVTSKTHTSTHTDYIVDLFRRMENVQKWTKEYISWLVCWIITVIIWATNATCIGLFKLMLHNKLNEETDNSHTEHVRCMCYRKIVNEMLPHTKCDFNWLYSGFCFICLLLLDPSCLSHSQASSDFTTKIGYCWQPTLYASKNIGQNLCWCGMCRICQTGFYLEKHSFSQTKPYDW